MNKRIGSMVFLVSALISGEGLAQGTPQQRAACTPDVFRLCSSEIPNIPGIIACLRRSKPSLSPACGAVFAEMDGRRAATRTLATADAVDATEWCNIGPSSPPGQDVWIAWCESRRGQ